MTILAFAAAIALLGCNPMGRYSPEETPPLAEFRDPCNELAMLSDLFKLHGGVLFDASVDRQVVWRDYTSFRVYQFRYHAVAIFPGGWNHDYYNIHIYAGQLPHNERMLNLMHHIRGGYNGKSAVFSPELKLDGSRFNSSQIGMHGAFLGQTSESYTQSVVGMKNNDARDFHGGESGLQKHYEDFFLATNNTYAFTRLNNGQSRPAPYRADYHMVVLQDGLVVYVQYICPSFEGPMLGQYAINKPLTPMLRTGVADLPIY